MKTRQGSCLRLGHERVTTSLRRRSRPSLLLKYKHHSHHSHCSPTPSPRHREHIVIVLRPTRAFPHPQTTSASLHPILPDLTSPSSLSHHQHAPVPPRTFPTQRHNLDSLIFNSQTFTMCDYTQREYECGHFRWIASKWCKDYTITHKRCQPNITHFEYRDDERCGM